MSFESLLPLIVIGSFALFFGLAIMAANASGKKTRESLGRLAGTMRLEVIEGEKKSFLGRTPPSLAGRFRGRDVRVFSYTTGSGKSTTYWIAVAAGAHNPTGYELRIAKENFLTRMGRKFGVEDMEFGDPGFDQLFFVKTNDQDYTRAALIPEIRAKLKEAWEAGAKGGVEVDGHEVKYSEVGSFSRKNVVERFPALAEVVYDICEIVDARG